MSWLRTTYLVVAGMALAMIAAAADPQWPDWDLEERVGAVSDSDLRLLPDGVPGSAHVHENHIRIQAESLADGWVELAQCHTQMDAVPATQISFHPSRIRKLQVTSAARIGRAWIEGSSVQLQDIQSGARLCVSAEIRALQDLGSGYYRLRNGPYMRRFLDGYYPMRVLIDVRYPMETLVLIRAQPPAQPGFELRSEAGRLRVDASFEGRLYTCLDFRTEEADGPSPDLTCAGD